MQKNVLMFSASILSSFPLPAVQLDDLSQLSTHKLDALAVLLHAKLYSCRLSYKVNRKPNGNLIYSQCWLFYQRNQLLPFFLRYGREATKGTVALLPSCGLSRFSGSLKVIAPCPLTLLYTHIHRNSLWEGSRSLDLLKGPAEELTDLHAFQSRENRAVTDATPSLPASSAGSPLRLATRYPGPCACMGRAPCLTEPAQNGTPRFPSSCRGKQWRWGKQWLWRALWILVLSHTPWHWTMLFRMDCVAMVHCFLHFYRDFKKKERKKKPVTKPGLAPLFPGW